MQYLETVWHFGDTMLRAVALDLLPLMLYVFFTMLLCVVFWKAFRKKAR